MKTKIRLLQVIFMIIMNKYKLVWGIRSVMIWEEGVVGGVGSEGLVVREIQIKWIIKMRNLPDMNKKKMNENLILILKKI